MMKKIIFTAIFFFSLINCTRKQNAENLKFIDNKKLSYTFIFYISKKSGFEYRVNTFLNHKQRSLIKNISKKKWIELLYSENSDFATNLILYEINDKEASDIFYSKLRNCKGDKMILNEYQKWWKKYKKHTDIAYWMRNLR